MALAPRASPFLAFEEVPQLESDFYLEREDARRGVAMVGLQEMAEPEEDAKPAFPCGTVAPRLPDDFELGPAVLRTAMRADAAGCALLGLFASYGDVSVEKVNVKKCSIKAHIDRGAFSCVLKARLYQSDMEHIVEFQRRIGDVLAFQELFYAAAAALDASFGNDAPMPSCSPPSLHAADDPDPWHLKTGLWVAAC